MPKKLSAIACAAAILSGAFPAIAQQPAQWSYSFRDGVATATYPGNIEVVGTINANASIDSFGADPTGNEPSDEAFTKALEEIGMNGGTLTGNGCVILGAGTYRFTAKIEVTLSQTARNDFCLRGQGANVSKMLWDQSDGGIAVTLTGQENSVQVSDLSLLTGVASGGTAFSMTNTGAFGGGDGNASNITRVYVAGADKTQNHDAASFYWSDGFVSTAVSNINYSFISVIGNVPSGNGNGITFQGDDATDTFAVACNVTSSYFYNLDKGFIVGTWQQGINIVQTIFVSGERAIYQPSGTEQTDMMTVTSSQFDTTADTIVLDGMTHSNIVGNLFFTRASNSAIAILGSQYATIQGNVINGNVGGVVPGGTGVFVASNLANNASVISGNVFHNLSYGVALNTGTSGWNVQANAYHGNTENYTNGGGGSNSVGVATP